MAAVRLLLDTHTILWWLFEDPKLSAAARLAIANPQNQILVSAASAWEITTKHRLGRLPEAGDVPVHLPRYLNRARFAVLNISLEHAIAAELFLVRTKIHSIACWLRRLASKIWRWPRPIRSLRTTVSR